jgi:hypothetical protein
MAPTPPSDTRRHTPPSLSIDGVQRVQNSPTSPTLLSLETVQKVQWPFEPSLDESGNQIPGPDSAYGFATFTDTTPATPPAVGDPKADAGLPPDARIAFGGDSCRPRAALPRLRRVRLLATGRRGRGAGSWCSGPSAWAWTEADVFGLPAVPPNPTRAGDGWPGSTSSASSGSRTAGRDLDRRGERHDRNTERRLGSIPPTAGTPGGPGKRSGAGGYPNPAAPRPSERMDGLPAAVSRRSERGPLNQPDTSPKDIGLAPFGSKCAHCKQPTGLRQFKDSHGRVHILHPACAKPFCAAMDAALPAA